MLFFSIPPSNSLISILDPPGRAFRADKVCWQRRGDHPRVGLCFQSFREKLTPFGVACSARRLLETVKSSCKPWLWVWGKNTWSQTFGDLGLHSPPFQTPLTPSILSPEKKLLALIVWQTWNVKLFGWANFPCLSRQPDFLRNYIVLLSSRNWPAVTEVEKTYCWSKLDIYDPF